MHIIDQTLDMYPDKKITSVFCRTNSIFNMDVDDYDKIVLTFEDGMVAQLEVNMYSMEPVSYTHLGLGLTEAGSGVAKYGGLQTITSNGR